MKKSEVTLITKAIEDLHRRNSGDYETLFRQIGKKHRVLDRNAAQVAANYWDKRRKKKTHIWSRATGKTHSAGDHMDNVVHEMPRSANNFIVPSYKKFLKEMLPSLRKSLEALGYYEGLHYFIGKRPPRNWHWPQPYMMPSDFTNIIYWYNGTIYQLVSQDVNGSGRGLSVDTEIKDEALLLDKAQADETSGATLRGSNVRQFKDNPMFGSSTEYSSMPILPSQKWLLERKQLALEFPNDYYYSMFNLGVNLHNLRPGYVADALKDALFLWKFEAEYLNIIPNLTVGAYYTLLKEERQGYIPKKSDYRKHDDCQYDYGNDDLKGDEPLIIGVDWGARINYLVVCQLREEKEGLILRALNEFWALGEEREIQSDMVQKFAEYYKVFATKRIILFCDRQGNNDTGITIETRVDMLINQLSNLGWSVDLASRGGANPLHEFRRALWESVLKESDNNLPKFRINLLNCRNLFISMQNAETKELSKGRITKNKKSEKQNSGIHPTHATDPSDAIDHVLFGICGEDFRFSNRQNLLTSFNT